MGEWTIEAAHRALRELASQAEEYAGIPMPIQDASLTMHPKHKLNQLLGEPPDSWGPDGTLHVCRSSDIDEQVSFRNGWLSKRLKRRIEVWQTDGKFRALYDDRMDSADMLLRTMGASQAWDIEAEITAIEKLRTLIKDHLWEMYFTSGMFLETSSRSGVTYIFRRLRPTIAVADTVDKKYKRILCTLCGHPLGYYKHSWAGALCPTDDVISHLLMMRADEHFYWRSMNQHAPWAPESGLVC